MDATGKSDYQEQDPAEIISLPARVELGATDLASQVDPVQLLLADKRSAATKRAYAGDLRDFFGGDPSPHQVRQFVAQPPRDIAVHLNTYKARLIGSGAAEATVNRRLSAVRSLLKFCYRLGYAASDGAGLVDSERVTTYRDTRGISVEQMRRLVVAPDARSLAGKRDRALLRLLCENALRRGEACALTVDDFQPAERRLFILGKGKGTQKEPVTLSSAAVDAVSAYLKRAGHGAGPLFRNVSRRPDHAGEGITPDGLYHVVGHWGAAIGVKNLTPHKLRHSAITAALDATDGDVRRVQKLSRHARLETLQRYDDNRTDFQGEVTDVLSDLLG